MNRWPKIQLRHVTRCLDAQRVPLNSVERADMSGDIPYWGANGIIDHINRKLFEEELVLLGEDGAPFFESGKDVAFRVSGPVWINNHIHVLRPIKINSGYLTYALNTVDYTAVISGSTRDKLTQEDMNRIELPYPAFENQQEIVLFLDMETARIDALVAKKQRMIELLLTRRIATTFQAVSGGLDENNSFDCSSISWLSEVPNHWKEVLLRLVARLGSGHTPSRDHPEWWINCTIPWITTGEVRLMRSDRTEYIEETREKISEIGLANSSAELDPADTVVLCRTASAGYSGIMKTPMATSQDFATWICGPLLRPRFLLLCLRAMREDLLDRLAMGSTHKTIYMPDIRSIQVPLPPLEEQDRIVNEAWIRLERIDEAVGLLEHQIRLLQEHRQALITAAVMGELDVSMRARR